MKPNILKRILGLLRDIIEIYIPAICFVTIFVAFIAQIFFRYVLRSPLGWSTELITILFVWLVFFGSLYSSRTESHVRFTMISDMLPKKIDKILEIAGDLLVLVLFVLSVKPTLEYINFMDVQKSSILRISMKWIQGPYIVMAIGAIIYAAVEIVNDVMFIFGKAPNSIEVKEEAK